MKTSEVLNKAADLIEERGWTTGPEGWPEFGNDTSALCLEGGIMAAVGIAQFEPDAEVGTRERLVACPAFTAVSTYLGAQFQTYPYRFNDEFGRTAADVIEVLRAAAVIEAARESEPAQVSA